MRANGGLDENGITFKILVEIPPDVMLDAVDFAQRRGLEAVKGIPLGPGKVVAYERAFRKANRQFIEDWIKQHGNIEARLYQEKTQSH